HAQCDQHDARRSRVTAEVAVPLDVPLGPPRLLRWWWGIATRRTLVRGGIAAGFASWRFGRARRAPGLARSAHVVRHPPRFVGQALGFAVELLRPIAPGVRSSIRRAVIAGEDDPRQNINRYRKVSTDDRGCSPQLA